MPAKDFHGHSFDSATLLKLEIFRGYVREWLPVFLKKPILPEVHIYDFFCGPGRDSAGRLGSPLLIIEEMEPYLSTPSGARIVLHFNDSDSNKIRALRTEVERREPRLAFADIRFTSLPFANAFDAAKDSLRDPGTANLLIIDQCGVKEITKSVLCTLVGCPVTDVLFFVSSSFVWRFVSEESIRRYFPKLTPETARSIPRKQFHRFLCDYYRELIPQGATYYLAPFSIEKDSGTNIYGIIFGSRNLRGLDKFLQVCWRKDQLTGEANFNIDDDSFREGQFSIFPEDNVIKKDDRYGQELVEFIAADRPDNRDLYRFSLLNGFPPSRTRQILKELQKGGTINVEYLAKDAAAKKGIYFLHWDYYNEPPRVRFSLKEPQ